MKHNKTTYLAILNEAGNNKQQFRKIPICHLAIDANNNFKHFKCCYHDVDDIYKLHAIFMKMLT